MGDDEESNDPDQKEGEVEDESSEEPTGSGDNR